MTMVEAEKEVKYLLGRSGFVKFGLSHKKGDKNSNPYLVGVRFYTAMGVEFFIERGRGNSWSEAIKAARDDLVSKNLPYGPNLAKFSEHAATKQPDKKSTIRRYMPIDRFKYLLESKKLWFSRADFLGDTFEGSYSKLNLELREQQYYSQLKEALGKNPTLEKFLEAVSRDKENARNSMFINCWQLNEYEDVGMWRAYIEEGKGIAIETTFERLTNSFQAVYEQPIVAGIVEYSDYEKEIVKEEFLYSAFLTKRKEFEHEREVRAILWLPEYYLEKPFEKKDAPKGVEIPVELHDLVQRIIISPFAPAGFDKEISELASKYGLPVPSASKLSAQPIL